MIITYAREMTIYNGFSDRLAVWIPDMSVTAMDRCLHSCVNLQMWIWNYYQNWSAVWQSVRMDRLQMGRGRNTGAWYGRYRNR